MKDIQDTTLAIRIPIYWKDKAWEMARFHDVSLSKYLRSLVEIDYMEHCSVRDFKRNSKDYFKSLNRTDIKYEDWVKDDSVKVTINKYNNERKITGGYNNA